MAGDAPDTSGPAYTRRLVARESAGWKRLLNVQAPYRWNLRRLLGGRAVLDVGCGIGRNLAYLGPGSVGVDHNIDSVEICRERGLTAFTPADLMASRYAAPGTFDGLLAAHIIEHLDPGTAGEVLAPYLGMLAPTARVVLICPQRRGFASDPTHTAYFDQIALAALGRELGLSVQRQYSFPFPEWAGSLFTYNEFVTVATFSDGGLTR